MDYKEIRKHLETKQLNMSRIKSALRGDVLFDRDHVRNLLHPKKFNVTMNEKTTLWAKRKGVKF